MKHLYIIVEGETEEEFVNKILLPYLYEQGLNTHIQALMITMKGGGHGFNDIEHLKETIKPLLHYQNEPVITTLIDHYGINSKKKLPDYEICNQEIEMKKRLACMENSLAEAVKELAPNYPYFIPNIIQHEMETLWFADVEGFNLEKEAIRIAIAKVCSTFPEIEDINHTPEGAPSKRLIKIYEENNEKYRKVDDGIVIAELIGIETMLAKAPRFKAWIEKIIQITKNTL